MKALLTAFLLSLCLNVSSTAKKKKKTLYFILVKPASFAYVDNEIFRGKIKKNAIIW